MLFLVDLCNMGFHSAAVQKMCPTPSTNQPSKFAQLLQLRLGELPGLDVRLRRNEGGVFQWDPVISNTYLHYIILYTHIYFRNHGTKDRSQWSTTVIVFAALFSTCFFSTDLVISPPNSPPISTTLTEIISTIQFNDVQSMQLEKSENYLKVSENALATIMATKCNQYSNRKSPTSFSFNDWDSNPPILERSAGSGSFRSTCQPPPIRTYKSWILACYSEHCNIVGSSLRVGLLEIVVNLFFGFRKLQKSSVLSWHMESIPRGSPWKSSPHFG